MVGGGWGEGLSPPPSFSPRARCHGLATMASPGGAMGGSPHGSPRAGPPEVLPQYFWPRVPPRYLAKCLCTFFLGENKNVSAHWGQRAPRGRPRKRTTSPKRVQVRPRQGNTSKILLASKANAFLVAESIQYFYATAIDPMVRWHPASRANLVEPHLATAHQPGCSQRARGRTTRRRRTPRSCRRRPPRSCC